MKVAKKNCNIKVETKKNQQAQKKIKYIYQSVQEKKKLKPVLDI